MQVPYIQTPQGQTKISPFRTTALWLVSVLVATICTSSRVSAELLAMYAIDFVDTAANGADMNDAGEIIGTHYVDNGCGSQCMPPQEKVVWRGNAPVPLPPLNAFDISGHNPKFINNSGDIVGTLSTTGGPIVVLWQPSGTSSFNVVDLGAPTGAYNSIDIRGFDDVGRVYVWAQASLGGVGAVYDPSSSSWTELGDMGFANEMPFAVSSNGWVATATATYKIDDPSTLLALPPPPTGYRAPNYFAGSINNNGDRAHFLGTTQSSSLMTPHRLPYGGTWDRLATFGPSALSIYGMGSISNDLDVTLTMFQTGYGASGPSSDISTLASRVSSAYQQSIVSGGVINAAGEIMVGAYIGASSRLARMVPVTPCTTNCIKVAVLAVYAQFQGTNCLNGETVSSVEALVVDENGAPLANAQITGHFLDSYWMNQKEVLTTNSNGFASMSFSSPPCTGTIAFYVDSVISGTRTLDRTKGKLTDSDIGNANADPPKPVDVVIDSHSVSIVNNRGQATIQINIAETLVGKSGAVVTGTWYGDYSGTGTGTTDNNGSVTIQTARVSGSSDYTFCITSLTGDGVVAQTGLNNCVNNNNGPVQPPPPTPAPTRSPVAPTTPAPAPSCGSKNDPCTANNQCCSGRCRRRRGVCR